MPVTVNLNSALPQNWGIDIPCRAAENLTLGNIVFLTQSGGNWHANQSNGVTDPGFAGVALATVASGASVRVKVQGIAVVSTSLSGLSGAAQNLPLAPAAAGACAPRSTSLTPALGTVWSLANNQIKLNGWGPHA
ncbi:MAG: hypothetical protein ACIAQU_04355 [Phycisphaerales bacterium JB064]